MFNLILKVTALAFAASALAKAAGLNQLAVAAPATWTSVLVIGILSFGLAMIAGLTIGWNFHKPEKSKRDVEAYIDQMLVANGTHLNRERA